MSVLVRELDSLFNEALMNYDRSVEPSLYHSWQDAETYNLQIRMTGVKKEELKVEVHNGTLTVESKPTLKSFYVSPYKNNFILAKDVDVDKVEAKLEDGLLTVKAPKTKVNKKTINVV